MNLLKRIILTFIFVLSFMTIKVNALTNDTTISIEMIPDVYSNKETPYQNFWIQFDYLYINGKIGYCIQPGIRITTRTYSSYSDFNLFNLSDDDRRNLELISYYGYTYPNHQTLEYYMATQELIWRYLGITSLNFTTEANYGGDVIDIEYYKNEIKKLIERHNIKPSFNNINKTGIVGETVVYEDTNGVLNEYVIVDSGNNDAWIDNNKLYVKVNNKGLSEIKLRKTTHSGDESYIYLSNNSQTLATFGLNEEIDSSVFVNGLYKGIININKKGNYIEDINNGDYTYQDKPLENISYNIYADANIIENGILVYSKGDIVETVTTNSRGNATSNLLPIGSYCILESKTDPYYIKDDDKYCFIFDENRQTNGIVFQQYNFRNELKMGEYRLKKLGETTNGVVNNVFDYILVGLPGVKFGIYANENIYNTNGDLLVAKDNLLFEIITDENGIIDIMLPIGSYYIKELITPPGYEIDNNQYYFDITLGNIQLLENEFINKIKKSKITITKMDKDTEQLLSDTSYHIYDDNNNFIMELTTDDNGKIDFELPFGHYLLKENKSKYGYLVDDKTYELDVLDSQDIDISLFNQKIPMPITSDYQNNIKIISFFLFIIGILLIYGSKSKTHN